MINLQCGGVDVKKFLLNLFGVWRVVSMVGVFCLESYTPVWLSVIIVAGFIANLFVLWGSKSEVRGCTVILLLIDLFFVYAVYKEAFQWTPRNRMLVLLGTNIYLLFLHLFQPFEEEQSAGS